MHESPYPLPQFRNQFAFVRYHPPAAVNWCLLLLVFMLHGDALALGISLRKLPAAAGVEIAAACVPFRERNAPIKTSVENERQYPMPGNRHHLNHHS